MSEHVHRAALAGDGCRVCDELFLDWARRWEHQRRLAEARVAEIREANELAWRDWRFRSDHTCRGPLLSPELMESCEACAHNVRVYSGLDHDPGDEDRG